MATNTLQMFVEFDALSAQRLNALVDAINELQAKSQPVPSMAALAGVAMVASASTRKVSRRSLLGLG